MSAPIPACAFEGSKPDRLWSALEMLKVTAQEYINLGRQIHDAESSFDSWASKLGGLLGGEDAKREWQVRLRYHLTSLRDQCEKLGLSTALRLIRRRVDDPPQTRREFDLLIDAIWAELDGKLFFFVPSYRSPYFDAHGLSLPAASEFRRSAAELRLAGNCYAFGEPTAAVFHAMRAAEICVRILAEAIGAEFDTPVEQQNWQAILNRVAGRIKEIGKEANTPERKGDLEFFGQASAQLQFFKDGWRVRASHAGELCSEAQARDAIDHVRALIEILAERLSELP